MLSTFFLFGFLFWEKVVEHFGDRPAAWVKQAEPMQAVMIPLRSEISSLQKIEQKETTEQNQTIQESEPHLYQWKAFVQNSLETQAGQMLIVGLVDQKPSQELKEFLEMVRPGGFVLFRRNYKTVQQLKQLIQFLHETSLDYSETIPLIAIDEEGGTVTRLPWKYKLPSAHLLAQVNQPELTQAFGLEVGKVLINFGINVNFAPVLDLSTPDQFLKTRAYGDDQEVVERHGLAYAKGLMDAGVIPVAKHFPGLSPTKKDPHHDKTKHVYKGKEDFLEEISPFYKFSKTYPASGVMLSHTIYPQFNAQKSAVMSSELITYLKKDLKFQGVVISDDLQMQGISYDPEEGESRMQTIVKKSFTAGCDMMMLSYSKKDQKQAHQKLMEMLTIPENKRIAYEKIFRILKVKNHIQQQQSQQRQPASLQTNQTRVSVVDERMSSAGLDALHARLQQSLKSQGR